MRMPSRQRDNMQARSWQALGTGSHPTWLFSIDHARRAMGATMKVDAPLPHCSGVACHVAVESNWVQSV